MSINTKTLLAATALAFTAASVNAVTIAEYTFTSGSTASTGPLGSNIGFEAGITGSSTAGDELSIHGGQTAGSALGPTIYTDTDEERIASENWVTFSIAVSAAQEIDLTSLTFNYDAILPAQFSFGVYTSKTGFTEGDHLLGLLTNTASSYSTPLDLSGIGSLQNLTDETVEFRFLLGDDSGSNTRIYALDNIVLNGDVTAVPEPSTTALLGLGGLALILRRRK